MFMCNEEDCRWYGRAHVGGHSWRWGTKSAEAGRDTRWDCHTGQSSKGSSGSGKSEGVGTSGGGGRSRRSPENKQRTLLSAEELRLKGRERQKRYREKNRDRYNAYMRAYRRRGRGDDG